MKRICTYLRLANKPLGLLLNFNVVHLLDGIKRVLNNKYRTAIAAAQVVNRSKIPLRTPFLCVSKVLNQIRARIWGMPLVTALILVHVLIFSRSLLARRL